MAFKKSASDSATVHEIFQGEVLYRSPLFQRHYVWSKEQLDTLWADIDTVLEESSSSRFLGALVLKPYQDRTATKPQAFWIIDGQQRLTTFYLLIVACAYRAEVLGNSDLARDYVTAYLLHNQSSVRGEPKLVPTIPDLGQFREILRFIASHNPKPIGGEFGKNKGDLVDAFLKHLEEIEKRILVDEEPSVKRLEKLLEDISNRFEFVQINLAEHHDANEVFNRLNTSGQPLDIIDLIRNEVFSLLSDDVSEAESIYDGHWIEFEKSFDLSDDEKKNAAIRNGYFFPFALIRDSSTKKAEVFAKLSLQWKTQVKSMEARSAAKAIIDGLREYVPAYLALSSGNRLSSVSDEFWETVLRLYRMPAPTTLYPYTMRLLLALRKGDIDETSAAACLEVIESFLVRRSFLGLEPTGLHAVFKDLWKKAGADSEKVKRFVQTTTIEFPDDDRFIERIKSTDLYHRKLCIYVLEEYERSFTRGDVLKSFPPITVDHVMPQSRSGEWLNVVSEEEHEQYLHTWANLVPLSNKANSEKGSKSWVEVKQKLQHETVFATTKSLIASHDEWGIDEIASRAEVLANWAVKRWPK